jgi:hypothetical protein
LKAAFKKTIGVKQQREHRLTDKSFAGITRNKDIRLNSCDNPIY